MMFETLMQSNTGTGVVVVVLAFAVYHVVRAIYLIYFSPLSVFPGSPWAAVGE
jgi:hypothetical protein